MDPISQVMCHVKQVPLKRKRDCGESSLTFQSLRPDLLWLLGQTMLFKGEDKTLASDMDQAEKDLMNKMKDWDNAYHGQVRLQMQ
jgi:hypothetical protein